MPRRSEGANAFLGAFRQCTRALAQTAAAALESYELAQADDDPARSRQIPPLRQDLRGAADMDRQDRQAKAEREQRGAALEGADIRRRAARALRIGDQDPAAAPE